MTMTPFKEDKQAAAYEDARMAVAKMLAAQADEPLGPKYYNLAHKILWPHLTLEMQSKLVLR